MTFEWSALVLTLSQHHQLAITAHAEEAYPEECCGLMLGKIERPASQPATTYSQTTHAQTSSAPTIEPVKHLVQVVPLPNQWTPALTCESLAPQDLDPQDSNPQNLDSQNLDPQNLDSQPFSDVATQTKQRRYWIDPQDLLRVQKEARSQNLAIIGIYHSHPDHPAVPSECDRTLAWPTYAYVIVSVHNGNAVDVKNWTLDSEHQFQPEVMKVSPSAARDRMPKCDDHDRLPKTAASSKSPKILV